MIHATKVSAILKRTMHETKITQTRTKPVVINTCYGGFGLSSAALIRYKEISGKLNVVVESHNIPRDDPTLVRVVRELGDGANTNYSNLKVVEIPHDVDWYITDYDGIETVAEKHRTWS